MVVNYYLKWLVYIFQISNMNTGTYIIDFALLKAVCGERFSISLMRIDIHVYNDNYIRHSQVIFHKTVE